jgi:methyl-accepting chemotaxis protein
VKESDLLIEQYIAGFSEVVRLIEQRHLVVRQELAASGLNMRKKMTEIIEYTNSINNAKAVYQSAKAQEALLLGRVYVMKFLASNTDVDYQRATKELSINIQDNFTALQSSLNSNSGRQLMQEFTAYYDNYLKALKQVYSIITQRNNLIDNTLNSIGPIVADKIEQVKLSVKAEQDELGPKVQSDAETTVLIVELVTLISIILGMTAAYFLPKIIREPIGGEPTEIADITETIANGDLTQSFDTQGSATGIYRSIIHMRTNLKTLITGIVSTGNSIAKSANNFAEVAKQTNQAVLQQKERTAQVATAINEMSYSIQEMVNLSSQSSKSAQEAQNQAQQGKITMDATVASIGSLAAQVESSVNMIKSLEQNSHDIGSVIEVIRNISEQTNLLALNAAIEAARAGEQGRGFAVVADEVRTLAQRTQASTQEIQDTVNALQKGTQNAVKSMEDSGEEAIRTVEQSSATVKALDSVISTINKITEMNSQVAVAVEEQSSVTADIIANVTAISDSSEITSVAAADAASSAQVMANLAEQLQKSVRGFKVDS